MSSDDGVGWLRRVRAEPSLLGEPNLLCLQSFLGGALIGELAIQDCNTVRGSREWRLIQAFKDEFSMEGRGAFDAFLCRFCTDSVQAVHRFFEVLGTLEPAECLVHAPTQEWSFEELIHYVGLRPGMYIGSMRLETLYAFLNGYLWRRRSLGSPDPAEELWFQLEDELREKHSMRSDRTLLHALRYEVMNDEPSHFFERWHEYFGEDRDEEPE